jgi:small subunit ribosomal protein S6
LLEVNNLETGVKKLYEGMFLIDSAEAAKDWDGVIELIKKTLAKADAEIVSIRKWDERPLAYTISKCNRGTYILAYFKADGQKIHDVERDVQLSDRIMRALILKGDHLTEADIAKDTPATHTERPVQAVDKTTPQPEAKPEQAEPAAADNVSASQTAEE